MQYQHHTTHTHHIARKHAVHGYFGFFYYRNRENLRVWGIPAMRRRHGFGRGRRYSFFMQRCYKNTTFWFLGRWRVLLGWFCFSCHLQALFLVLASCWTQHAIHLGRFCFKYRYISATFRLFAAWMVYDGCSIGALTFLGLLFWLLLLILEYFLHSCGADASHSLLFQF